MTRDVEQRGGEPLGEPASVLPRAGDIFDGKYRIGRAIGEGAMAVVLEATHLNLEDRVAIKILLPRWAADPALVERFMREGRAATRIRSEHVVRVFDVGVAGGHPYLVMEYLEGSDLDQVVASTGPLSVTVAIDYVLQACEAIAEAHVRGIVHRDLKPANLFLTRRADASPCVKVLDFGISKATEGPSAEMAATEPSAVMGSPYYMSPEQLLSSTDVDVRSDVWALGAMLHELVVGSPPFDGDTFAALSAAILRDAPPKLTALRPEVPAAVEAAVLRCLAKEPSRRFPDVAELAAALAELGSASARASSERIARILDGGTGKLSVRVPPVRELAEPVPLLSTVAAPPRARGRLLGYVVAATAFVAVGSAVAWMVASNDRALREAEEREQARAVASSVVDASAPTPAGTASVASAVGQAPATSNDASTGEHAAQVASATPSPRPVTVTHRGPRRGPRVQPRVAPLPDFPIPSADPQGEPSSRPIDRTGDSGP